MHQTHSRKLILVVVIILKLLILLPHSGITLVCKKLPLFGKILSLELRSCSSDEPDDNVLASPQHSLAMVSSSQRPV